MRVVAATPPTVIALMADWIAIARIEECPPGASIERVAGDRMVALANVDGTLHALDGLCPHQGGPLGTGRLCGTILTCPWHGWQFDVVTGRHQISELVLQPVHEVRVTDGVVEVRIRSGSPAGLGGDP